MKAKLTILVLVATFTLVIIMMSSCGSNSSTHLNQTASNSQNLKTKYLAKNVIFKSAGFAPLSGAPKYFSTSDSDSESENDEIDTVTKVLAENVIIETTNTDLTALNVQEAFEETIPKLSKIIIGTWNIVNYSDNTGEKTTGTITFNEDGTISHTGNIEMFGAASFLSESLNSYTIIEELVLQVNKMPNNYKINFFFSTLKSKILIIANPKYSYASYAVKAD